VATDPGASVRATDLAILRGMLLMRPAGIPWICVSLALAGRLRVRARSSWLAVRAVRKVLGLGGPERGLHGRSIDGPRRKDVWIGAGTEERGGQESRSAGGRCQQQLPPKQVSPRSLGRSPRERPSPPDTTKTYLART